MAATVVERQPREHTFPLAPTLIVILAIFYKAVWLALNVVPFNGDESIVALMARHILQGERPVFMYGYAYVGSTGAWLTAFSFSIFGQSVLAIRSVQVTLFAATLITTYFVARRFDLSRWSASIAMLLFAIPPLMLTQFTTAPVGGYGETLLLGNILVLMADSRWLMADGERSSVNHPPFAIRYLLLGVVAGFGFYTFSLFLIYLIPVSLWLLVSWLKLGRQVLRQSWRAILRHCLFGLIGFAIGAAPWWLALIQAGGTLGNGALSMAVAGLAKGIDLNTIGVGLLDFFVFGLSVFFGLRYSWSIDQLPPVLFSAGLMLIIGGLGYVLMRRSAGRIKVGFRFFEVVVMALAILIGLLYFPAIPQLITPALGAVVLFVYLAASIYAVQHAPKILLGMFGVLLLAFLVTPLGGEPSGRYFLPLYLPLAIFTAIMLERLREITSKALVGLLVVFILGYNVITTGVAAALPPPGITTQLDPVSAGIDHTRDQSLIDFLLAHNETRGYSNFWTAFPIVFLSGEQIIISAQLPYHLDLSYYPLDDRYAPYTQAVAQAPRAFYLTTNQPQLDDLIRASLTRLTVNFSEYAIGTYHIFYGLSRKVIPSELQIPQVSKQPN
jgi:4-amino-4-deoxy-L-arabinose transferase-like glycosyltransferase